MIGKSNMLLWSTGVRQGLLQVYGSYPSLGFETGQRMVREIGDVTVEMHGREKAAVMIYGVADSIATKGELPKLPAIGPTKRLEWAHWNLLLVGVVIGFFIGDAFRAWGITP